MVIVFAETTTYATRLDILAHTIVSHGSYRIASFFVLCIMMKMMTMIMTMTMTMMIMYSIV